MKYMLLMYADPTETQAMSAQSRNVVARKHNAIVEELTASGELLDGAGLGYPWDTVTMRWRDNDDPIITDGPFTAGREQLTAYYVVDCADANRARELAARLLDFHVTGVETRRIHT